MVFDTCIFGEGQRVELDLNYLFNLNRVDGVEAILHTLERRRYVSKR